VHKTVHRLSCYMNIPKYSKLFIQIAWKRLSGKRLSARKVIVRETSCTGNNRRVKASRLPGNVLSGKRLGPWKVLSGKVIVLERSCPAKRLSGKVIVRETGFLWTVQF